MVSLFVQTATQSGVKYAKGLCVTDINMGQREIKFRAWDKDEKKMLEVGMLGINFARSHRSEMQDGSWSVGTMDSGLVLMQYTGLKDKNGKEIYEGDILAYWDNSLDSWDTYRCDDYDQRTPPVILECVYEGLAFVFKSKEDSRSFVDEWCEVIGNQHENPELLCQ